MDPTARRALLTIPQEDLGVATGDELALYSQALEQSLQLLSPIDYAAHVSGATRYPHIVELNRWLMALLDGRLYFDGPGPVVDVSGFHPLRGDRPVYNLAISMPPRHGKSYLVSEHLPAWFLTQYPDYSILLASYEANFAAEWGGKARDHVVEHPEFGVEVEGGKSAARSMWSLSGHRGFMKCAGAGGPLTGSGGQLCVVDDPIKNAEQAMSALERDNHDNWWKTTLYTRREPWKDGTPGRIVLMSTRWHEDDLHVRRIPEAPVVGDQWAQLNLMAIFEPTDREPVDPIGREPGVELCAERMPHRELELTRDEMGESWFQAMFQGHPSLDDGNLIRRPFNYYTIDDGTYETVDDSGAREYFDEGTAYRFATLDLAATDKKTADFTVLMVFDVSASSPRKLFVRAIERERITTENHEAMVIDWYHKWKLQALHIEKMTFGTNLLGRLVGQPGMIVTALKADTNKIVRAMPVQYEIRNGMVFFPREADWLRTFEAELTKFPNSTHDDLVDTLGYGVAVYKSLPAWIQKRVEPSTPDEVVWDHMRKLGRQNQKSRGHRYPGIGKW